MNKPISNPAKSHKPATATTPTRKDRNNPANVHSLLSCLFIVVAISPPHILNKVIMLPRSYIMCADWYSILNSNHYRKTCRGEKMAKKTHGWKGRVHPLANFWE
jgi:hypothetical protein